MKRNKKVALIVAIVLLIAIMALLPFIKRTFFAGGEDNIPAAEAGGGSRSLNVNAMIMKHESLEQVYKAPGFIYPDEDTELVFATSGILLEIFFEEGQGVKKGELLAKIKDSTLQAELKKLEAQVPLAEARVYRQQELLNKEAVSLESYESVVTELDKLQADIELVRARISQTELRAPFDGVLGLRQVSPGIYATPTTPIVRLTKIIPLKIDFQVSEKDLEIIKVGTEVYFETDNHPGTHRATVYAVESTVDRQFYAAVVRARFPNPGGAIKPGVSARVAFDIPDSGESLLVPAIALTADLGRDYVYVYHDGVARVQDVRKGERTASSVEILDGLIPGDTVITSGVMQLRDGMAVTINLTEN